MLASGNQAQDRRRTGGAKAPPLPSVAMYPVKRRLPSSAVVWPAAVFVLLMASSLSPFSFELGTVRTTSACEPAAIGWPASNFEDLATNIIVYMPLGLAVCLWLRPRLGLPGAIAAALLAGAGASVLAESLQTLISVRTASWIDVGVNAIGALLGALITPAVAACARTAVSRIRAGIAAKPVTTLAALAAVGLVISGLWPFDFVGGTAELHGSLARSHWFPLNTSPGDDVPMLAHQPVMPTVGFAALFAAFGFLAALAGRENARSRPHSVQEAVVHAAILALLIETVQVLVNSRSFDLSDAILNTLAATLGAYFAVCAVDAPSRSQWVGRPEALLRPLLLVPALLVQVGYRLLDAAGVAEAGRSAAGSATVLWLPFSALYGRSLASVLAQAVSVCGTAALLAVTVAALIHAVGERTRWLVATTAAVTLAATCEALQYHVGGHVADVTVPLFAAAGALLAAAAWRRLRASGPMTASAIHR